jgi:hypothetical protein
MDGETINKNFAKAFNDIVNKYDNAAEEEPAYQELSLNQCIAMARSLLTEPWIPNYHTMKILLLYDITFKIQTCIRSYTDILSQTCQHGRRLRRGG